MKVSHAFLYALINRHVTTQREPTGYCSSPYHGAVITNIHQCCCLSALLAAAVRNDKYATGIIDHLQSQLILLQKSVGPDQWNMIENAIQESGIQGQHPMILLGTLLALQYLIATESYALESFCIPSADDDFPEFIMTSLEQKTRVLFEVRNVLIPEALPPNADQCSRHIQQMLDHARFRKNEGIEHLLVHNIVTVIWANNVILQMLAKAINHQYIDNVGISGALGLRMYYNSTGKTFQKSGAIRSLFS